MSSHRPNSRTPKLVTVKMDDLDDLTPMQERFVDAYLKDPTSGRAAAIKAGSAPAGAAAVANQWLNIPKVAAAIAIRMNERAERTQITRDRILQELAIIGFSNVDDYEIDGTGTITVRSGVPEHALKAISSMKQKQYKDKMGVMHYETEFKLWPKTEALRLMMGHLGMLVSRLSILDHEGSPVSPAIAAMSDDELREEAKKVLRLMA